MLRRVLGFLIDEPTVLYGYLSDYVERSRNGANTGRAVCARPATACSGNNSSSTAPSTPTPPNIIAAWAGDASLDMVQGGVHVTNHCDTTWTVTAQSGTSISGNYTLSGGTVIACGSSGPWGGTVDVNGSVSIPFSATVIAGCTRTVNPPLTGVVSGSSMTLTQTNQYVCSPAGATQQIVTLTLTKR